MRRDARILLSTLGLGVVALWGHRVPEALAGLDVFRVRDVDVRGARYVDAAEVVERLDLAPTATVWLDTGVLEERLRGHPLIRDAEVSRRMPAGLLVTLSERRPIALAPTPVLEPLDAEGRRLPLDPTEHRLDLPVIATGSRPPERSTVFPEDVRALAEEVEHLMSADTAFLQMVSSVRRDERGALVVRWTEPPVEFLLPSKASPARLREGLGALSNAISRTPGDVPREIDLRFADQVVVRRARK